MTIYCYFSGICKYATSDEYILLVLSPKQMQPGNDLDCLSALDNF